MSDPESLHDYIRGVQENTQKYLRDLTSENEKLCELILTLQEHLDKARKDRAEDLSRIRAVEAERQAYKERYQEVEEANDNVSKLYAATLRLHSTISHEDVLAAIHEIIINLVGSEEFVVYEMSLDGGELVRSSSFGVDKGRLDPVAVGTGIIGRAAHTGDSFVLGSASDEEVQHRVPIEAGLTACVPFLVEGVVVGAVAIWKLLGHKPRLEPVDFELFTLLGSHAATALYCTGIVESTGAPKSLHLRAAAQSVAPPRGSSLPPRNR